MRNRVFSRLLNESTTLKLSRVRAIARKLTTGTGPVAPGVPVRMQPRVLIICERAAERETIRVLVGTMGCRWVLASSIEEALAMLSLERISAALLELPRAVSDPDQMHKNVREFLVWFPGRVMALTDGMPTPAISELISKYSIPWVQRDRLAMDLWPRLNPWNGVFGDQFTYGR